VRATEGMSVLVTGGGSGLGEATARRLVAHGARVTICGRRAEPLAAIAADLGAGCLAVTADISDTGQHAALLEQAIAHGGGRLDAIVNAAGNMYRGPVDQLLESELTAVFQSNVIGPMILLGAAKKHLAETGGAIVFFGSVHTQRSFPGASPYAATKGALETLTRVLAAELGPAQIRVNCVRPGAVFTQINQRAGLSDDAEALQRLKDMSSSHALGRIGTPEEIAESVEFLLGAEWITGSVLTVDGGLSLGTTQA
jgi:NAD(P)-dependent dehydrogenase (short-subunit alcohol dehydrogenase family)